MSDLIEARDFEVKGTTLVPLSERGALALAAAMKTPVFPFTLARFLDKPQTGVLFQANVQMEEAKRILNQNA